MTLLTHGMNISSVFLDFVRVVSACGPGRCRSEAYAANDNPFEGEELARMRADRTKNAQPLGDIPLVVLVRGLPDEQGPGAHALEDEHKREQVALPGLSRKGRHVMANRSGHHVQLDEPDLVVTAIHDVVTASRKLGQ